MALLQPARITAPAAGRIADSDRPGTSIREGGLIAKLAASGSSQIVEIRSPIPGRIRSVAQTGANLGQGSELAVIDPATEQVWEALRALYLIGQPEDIPSIQPYERDLPDVSNDVRQQAIETERAIRRRHPEEISRVGQTGGRAFLFLHTDDFCGGGGGGRGGEGGRGGGGGVGVCEGTGGG